jgi:predicted HTH transcriptional regulator
MGPRKGFQRPMGGAVGYRTVHELLWRYIERLPMKPFTSRELAQVTHVDEKTVRKHLWNLVEEGKLEATGQQGRFVLFQRERP